MAILGNFWTTMKQKQSMVIFVNYKDNYDTTTTTTTANKSMSFDLSATPFLLQWPSVRWIWSILEDEPKNEIEPKNKDQLKNEDEP